ncbi:MAG: lipid hydroperoxide peroxidase [Deltaproteobacteria bacterium RIFCSPLOWO2_02_FULL_44_10]|nr:MAG: lipid hydroperoxide peroxidase [Deltaproteobacteria bacterium RIFCSPLOWO2_02_FULL_44_10]
MATITLKGNPVTTFGELPRIGTTAPNFKLINNSLEEITLENYKGKKKVVSIFPSIDTPVCATSVKKFNEAATHLKNTVVLNVAADLPFALKRFCSAEKIENVFTLSTFRSHFAKDWGVEMLSSPFAGLCCRAVVILDENNKVLYTELVPEIAQEPNYDKALTALKN